MHDENKDVRRKFYSSLNYNEKLNLEFSAEKINEQMDKLISLNREELSLILSKLKELLPFILNHL